MRVRLSYRTPIDVEAYDAGIVLRLVRLLAEVSFATEEGWLGIEAAIVDTGAPVSVIPSGVWQQAECRPLTSGDFDIAIGGTPTTGKLAELTLRCPDQSTVSPSLNVRAYLLADDTHPLVLGFEDILTELVLHCDFTSRDAYLDFASVLSS